MKEFSAADRHHVTSLPATIPSPPSSRPGYFPMDSIDVDLVQKLHQDCLGPPPPPPHREIPSVCGNRLTCLFIVAMPTVASVAMASFWMFFCEKEYSRVSNEHEMISQQLLHIGRLIVDINAEREWTIMYVTARNQESQWDVRRSLDDARKTTDQSLDDLQDTWWTENEYGQTFRSPRLFSAVLENYRSGLKAGSRLFLEDLQFYTNVIDALLGWLNSEIQLYNGGHASQWLLTYSYLMGSLNQLGAEQALCGAFHSVVCFSRREIFYHANVSFAAEATFRLYRQTFPVDRESDFRTRPHFRFFPSLASCRQEIFSESSDFFGMAIDPSACDYSRRNETVFHETDLLTVTELGQVVQGIELMQASGLWRSFVRVVLAGIWLACVIGYLLTAHSLKFFCCRYVEGSRRQRAKRPAWTPKDVDLTTEGQIMEQLIIGKPSSSDGTCVTKYEVLNGVVHLQEVVLRT